MHRKRREARSVRVRAAGATLKLRSTEKAPPCSGGGQQWGSLERVSRSVGFCGQSHHPARWSHSGTRDPAPKRSLGSLDDTGSPADRYQLRSHALQSAHLEPKWASVSQQPLRLTIRTRPVISLSMPWSVPSLSCFFSSRYADAEALFRRSLAIREKVLSPDHPAVKQSPG